MDRLEQALAIWVAWAADGGTEPPAALLARHPELADLLEAMLADRDALETPAAEPRRIGEFRIDGEIGRGGMGVVYRAHQPSLDRVVALKVLPDHVTRQPSTVARFRREATTAARLVHPGIVPIHAVGSDGDVHWFAMELIDGAPLGRIDPRTGAPRPVHQCVDLIAHVADALAHAHAQGVVHRDVKPSNILVRPDGTPVLTDFGLARDADQPGLTRDGAFAGTPFYVAPEQARGGKVDGRTDVFSLGATLYELLTQERPFRGATVSEVLAAVERDEPIDPCRIVPTLSVDLAAIVLRALEKDPARRYGSAAAFAADLRAFLDHRPIAARHASTFRRVRRWVQREPFRAALAAVLAVAIPAVSGSVGYLLAHRGVIEVGTAEVERQARDEDLARITIDYEAGDFAAALERADAVVARDPADVEARTLRALARLAGQNRGPVLDDFDGADRGEPRLVDRARAYLLATRGDDEAAAEIERRLGTPVQASELFLAGCLAAQRTRRDALGGDAWRSVFDLFDRAIHVSPAPRVHYYVRWTDAALMTNDAGAIASCVHALRTLWPDSPAALLYLAYAARRVDPGQAVTDYRRVLAAGYDHPRIHRTIADCLDRLGDADGARAARRASIASLRARQARGRATIEEQVNAAMTFEELGDRDAALATIAAVTTNVPDMPQARIVHGWLLAKADRTDEAVEQFRAAAALRPRDPEPLRRLGEVLLQRGEHAAAADVYAQWTALEPTNALAWHVLGNARLASQDVAGALTANERAVELDAKRPEFQFNLAFALWTANEHARARDVCRATLALRPDYVRAFVLLADIEIARGDPTAALDAADRATTQDPRSISAWCALGRARRAADDIAGARNAYAHALELGPSAAERPSIEAAVAALPHAR